MRGAATAVLLALLTVGSRAAQAQPDCFPSRTSNEARTMAIFDVPFAFSGATAPSTAPAGRLFLGIEVSYLPNVDAATATATTCRPNKGPEHTDFLFAAPRPRVGVTLPAGFALEASWIPPVRLSDAKGNLFGFALSRATVLNPRGVVLGVRAHATVGRIDAPITCDDASLGDPNSECYQGTKSNDRFRPNVFGIEASIGWSLGHFLRPYVGAGYNRLEPRFQVNFTNQFGTTDRTRVSVNLNRAVLFAGATWLPTRNFELAGEIYSAPTDAVTGRVVAKVWLGR